MPKALSMIRKYYGDPYVQKIESFAHGILKLDYIRYFILHHFGGIYVDYDIEWYRKLPLILHNYELVFVREDDFRILGNPGLVKF